MLFATVNFVSKVTFAIFVKWWFFSNEYTIVVVCAFYSETWHYQIYICTTKKTGTCFMLILVRY